jgi:hypothetical protein
VAASIVQVGDVLTAVHHEDAGDDDIHGQVYHGEDAGHDKCNHGHVHHEDAGHDEDILVYAYHKNVDYKGIFMAMFIMSVMLKIFMVRHHGDDVHVEVYLLPCLSWGCWTR